MLRLIMVGLAAYLLVRLLRVLPMLSRWTEAGIRPLACNVCMSVWAALAALLLLRWFPPGLEWAAAAGVVLWSLEAAETLKPPPLPPPLARGPGDV